MHLQSAYPVIVTDKLRQCRDFYVENLGFQVVFEASWFVYLSSRETQAYGIAFMTPDHPSRPPGPEAFNGQGMFLTLQVEDAESQFREMEKHEVAIAYPLTDEPWGQRRFALVDQSGTWVDIVQQIEPAAGFWARYVS